MDETEHIKTADGCEITVCQPHQLEVCYQCRMDFADENKHAIADEARNQAAASKYKNGDSLGPGRLRAGTEVRMADRSAGEPQEPLEGRVCGIVEEAEEESDMVLADGLNYVVRVAGGGLKAYPVVWLHDEWLAKVGGKYVAASEALEIS